jgi:hypothetical protein
MRCELITPSASFERTFTDVRSVRGASQTGALEIFSGHVPFYATGNASPLHVLQQDGREEIFLLLRPTYRVWQDEQGETVVTVAAQQAFLREVDVHISLRTYVERLREILSTHEASSHEKIFLEEELLLTSKLVQDEK